MHKNTNIRPERIENNQCALVICQNCGDATILCLHPGCSSSVHQNTSIGYSAENRDPLRRFFTQHINRVHNKKTKAKTDPPPPLLDAKRTKTSTSSSVNLLADHQEDVHFDFDVCEDKDEANKGYSLDVDSRMEMSHADRTDCEFVDDFSSASESSVDESIGDYQAVDCDVDDIRSEEQIAYEELIIQDKSNIDSSDFGFDECTFEEGTSEESVYRYCDFEMYDFRPSQNEVEDCRKRKTLSRNQVYMYQKYLEKVKDNSNGAGGFQGVVSRAMSRLTNDLNGKVTTREAEVMFHYTRLVMKLPIAEQRRFTRFYTTSNACFGYDKVPIDANCGIRIPESYAEVRRLITEDNRSILMNFPTGNVFRINGHSCISLKEVFLLAAGHYGGFSFHKDGRTKTTNEDGLNGTEAVKTSIQDVFDVLRSSGKTEKEIDEFLIGFFYFWSDSFLRCYVKQKDNHVWILTVTISPPADQISTGKFTHVLAIGKNTEDHSEVIEHFHKEARELMNGFKCYYGDHNEIRDTALVCIFHSADRPESNELANTRKEGHYGLFRNWSVRVGSKFPACDKCYAIIAKNAAEETFEECTCSRCLCWTISEDDDPQMYPMSPESYPAFWPQQYNISEEDKEFFRKLFLPPERKPGMQHLGPMRQTSFALRSACIYAYHAYRVRTWKKTEAAQFLRTCNINDKRIGIVMEKAEYDGNLERISEPQEYLPEIWSTEEKHDIFKRFKRPDLPLHAIAHGIIDDVMQSIHQIFAHWKKFTEYVEKIANPTILDVAGFRLSWCKLKSLPKTAWIGENEMAYMRLMPYLCGRFFVTGNFSSEVSQHVTNIKRLINALQSFVSLVMSKGQTCPKRVQAVLKLLMSTAHQLQEEYGSLKKKAVIDDSNKKNTNLLNIIEDLSRDELISLLKQLSSSAVEEKNTPELRKCLDQKCTVNEMKKKLNELGLKMSSRGNAKKIDYQITLFSHLLNRNLSSNCASNKQAKNGDESDKERDFDGFMWKKGAWMSLCTNLASQITFLGNLPLIW